MPVLPKDGPRGRRNAVRVHANQLGINLDGERQRYGANPRALASAAKKLINDSTPSSQNDLFVVVAPPAGAFNGINTTFTLPAPVAGLNISVVFTDVSAQTGLPLRRTDVNPPGTTEFFFDINNPTQFTVGTPPDAADMLAVTFKKPA